MRIMTGAASVGMWACIVGIVAMTAGCGDRTAQTRDEADAPGAERHRLPAPPPRPAPLPSRSRSSMSALPDVDTRFLATLAALAQPPRNARFILDDWRLMYHWWHCPYRPQAVPIVKLDHTGGALRARTTSGAKFTHMNRRELKAKGYRPCPHCRPDLDAPARAPDTAYREPQPERYDEPPDALRHACPVGGRHVPGARDINNRLRCARCGQPMD